VHPHSLQRISEYLEHAGHGDKPGNALFRPLKNSSGSLDEALTGHGVYKDVVRKYARVFVRLSHDRGGFELRTNRSTYIFDHVRPHPLSVQPGSCGSW
jgi:hypothetical protein